MRKQAILLLVHEDSNILRKLIKILDSQYFDFIIHVDANTNIDSFKNIKDKINISNIYFVEDRINVRWGDYSIVEAEIRLLEEAIHRKYSYYHLLSGADFILKKPEEIYRYFSNQNKEFIQFWDIEIEKQKRFINRYKYFNPVYPKAKTLPNKLRYHLTRNISVFFQKILRIDRLKVIEYKIKMGSQWFSITDELANYVVEQESKIYSIFNRTQVPDESFLQTLAYNNEYFRNKIFDLSMDNNYSAVKREIFFVDNKVPHVWTIDDKEYLLNSNNFFARKFNLGDSIEIVEYLERHVTKND